MYAKTTDCDAFNNAFYYYGAYKYFYTYGFWSGGDNITVLNETNSYFYWNKGNRSIIRFF